MPRCTLPPSQRMLDLTRAVERITAKQGFPPSLRQLGDELGVGFARARNLAHAARDRGVLRFMDGVPRSMHVVRREERGA